MMKEIMKHVIAKLFYALGWSIDVIVLTILNFLICIPVTLCVWVLKRYWNPMRRNLNKEFRDSDAAHMCVLASLAANFIIAVLISVMIFACIELGWLTVVCGIFAFLLTVAFLVICLFAYIEYKETSSNRKNL